MADNFTVNTPTSSGDTFAADDIGGVKHQRVKISVGADGSATDVSTASPLPVSDAGGSLTTDNAGTFAVQESGGALTALQLIDDIIATIGSAITAKGAAVCGTDGTNARILKTDSSGELQVDVLTMPTTTVTGTVAATQSGTWTVQPGNTANTTAWKVDGSAVTQPVSGTVAVSGTVTVGSHAVTNAGTFVVQENGAALTALQLIDDPVATLGTTTYTEATSKGMIVGGVRRDADTTLVDTTNEIAPLQINSVGQLKVEIFDGGDSHTVDGTVAATQSGTWNVTNVSGTVSLPTGAATAANQTTANTSLANIDANVGTLTNTGIIVTSGSVSVSAVLPGTSATSLGKAEDAAHASGNVGVFALGIRSDTRGAAGMIAGTDGDYIGFQMNSSGDLRVDASAVAVPVTDNSGSLTVDNGGTFVVQENGAALTSLQLIDDAVATTASAITSKGMAISGTDGTNARVIKTDTSGELQVDVLTMPTTAVTQSGTWTVQPGNTANTTAWKVDASSVAVPVTDNSGSLTVDNNGTFAVQAQITPVTSGGLSVANFNTGDTYTALTNSAQAIKASAGQIYGWYMMNPSNATAYVMVYNIAAASVTVGTSTAQMVFAIPSGAAANAEFSNGIAFSTAISCAAATTGGGNTAPSTALEVMFYYK